MAYKEITDLPGTVETQSHNTMVLHIEGTHVDLPDATFVRDADLSREGQNLVIEGPHGTVIVESYFAQTAPPLLMAPDGNALTPDLVNSFMKNTAQYAEIQQASVSDVSPVGAVKEISGEATVTRTNGKVEILGVGSPIYQGDIVETSEEGAVNIVFIDESTFAVSNDARMAIDEYVFDPATNGGTTNFSVLKGVFVFTSGLIGREDPDDVEIKTPAGSIGIRGTIIAGNVDTGEITVIEGAIVLEDHNGHTLTLSSEFETALFHSNEGTIELVGQLSAKDVGDRYESIANVTTGLFSTIGEDTNTNDQTDTTDEKTGDKESLLDDMDIFSDDILLTNHDDQSLITQLVAQAFEEKTAGTDGTQGFVPPTSADLLPTTPPIGSTLEKFSFAENATSVNVARINAQFVDFANLNLVGISNNFFDITRESDTSFLVSLKAGATMDFEKPFNLQYKLSDIEGHEIGESSNLSITNVNESPILINDEPNNIGTSNFFSGSNNNFWSYDFSAAFSDQEGDIASYNIVTPPVGTGISAYSFDTNSGYMSITMDGAVDGSNYTFTVQALDSLSGVLNSITVTFDTIIQDNFTGILVSNNETFSSSGATVDNVIISSNSNNVFADGGNDTISVTGTNNNVMAGSGNDTITLTSGTANFLHGGSGGDTFNLSLMQSTKAYGGEDSDVFILNAAAVSDLQTFTTGLIINGGSDNVSATNPGDVMRLDASATSIDFSLIDDNIIKNIETLKTDNGVATVINLDYNSVIAMTDADNRLYIDMDDNDTLNFTNSPGHTFVNTGTTTNNGETYNVYTDGVITLMIDTENANVTGI